MSTEKRRKSKTPEEVPEPGDPDRKRVLNVLAQRRYRQRRREKIAALEAQVKGSSPPQALNRCTGDSSDSQSEQQHTFGSSSGSTPEGSPGGVELFDGAEDVMRSGEDVGLAFSELGFTQEPLDTQLFQDFALSNYPASMPPPAILDQPTQLSSSATAAPPLNFPLAADGGLLSVPIFPVMQAFSTIATALNVLSHIYDPSYLHTLPPMPYPSLPSNLHPTPAQITIPHHPFLDTLPWPSVREKLICMFAMPSALRPPNAQDDETGQAHAMVRLVQDLDDFENGLRIHGNLVGWGACNELVEEAWEVGEIFFRNWWWCLDKKIVENANKKRKERGLRPLRITG